VCDALVTFSLLSYFNFLIGTFRGVFFEGGGGPVFLFEGTPYCRLLWLVHSLTRETISILYVNMHPQACLAYGSISYMDPCLMRNNLVASSWTKRVGRCPPHNLLRILILLYIKLSWIELLLIKRKTNQIVLRS
jgi:hypothetical protein